MSLVKTRPNRKTFDSAAEVTRRYSVPRLGFPYNSNVNVVILSGVIVRDCFSMNRGGKPFAWSRMLHIDQGPQSRGIAITLRFSGSRKANWALQTLKKGERVIVWGSQYLGKHRRAGANYFYPWIDVESCTCAQPLQVDRDPAFVRLRGDHFQMLLHKAGVKPADLRVPEARMSAADLKGSNLDPFSIDEEVPQPEGNDHD